MDFTFTVPSGIPPITFGSTSTTTTATTADATSSKPPTPSTTTNAVDSLDEHISLKRIHGVGDTKQWRRRLIHQIEDRIKDRREALHNAQRHGFSVPANGSTSGSGSSGHRASSRSVNGGDEFSGAAVVGGSQEEAVGLTGQGLGGVPVGLGPGTVASRNNTYISEEEERRIVAEVWEAFKNENYEALAHAFQGMTDKELENIEQDILQHNYATDSDPMYENVMDMEETVMEEYVQQYMNQPNEHEAAANDEMTTAMSIAWTLLSSTPCIRCHQGAIIFEPVLPGSLAEGARAICTGVSGSVHGGVSREGRGGCGFRLERDALLYLANAANTHSQTCAGQLQVGYDEDMGLLVACPHCDFLA
ncbi:hypothetical protein BG015_009366 [Linnemannia schmuckeri]|uniref:Uncharacterized protein n=1 Tax=Linnemannia schmuckeri TaxID=64567 RepID=A0A9P5VEW1_9FUNG|nr:hypothetical protein BG015_009366 [Linnemannia schmuckeri]